MRIGDWTSDVCSSDLRAADQMFGDDLEELRTMETKDGRFVADHPVLLKALASIGREMGEAGIVPRLTGDAAEQAHDEVRSLREKIEAAQAKGDNSTANKLYAREQELLRSEEHTSEIQSLMRISY